MSLLGEIIIGVGVTLVSIMVLAGVVYLLRTVHSRLERIEAELFHEGHYPDQGLRQWARVWRGRLRQDVATVQDRLDRLEQACQDEWQAEKARRIQAEYNEFHAPPRDN